jgi:hypothetical protein
MKSSHHLLIPEGKVPRKISLELHQKSDEAMVLVNFDLKDEI